MTNLQAKAEDKDKNTERERIRHLAEWAGARTFPQLALGIGDDAALLHIPRGHQVAITTDLSLEGVHFRRDWHSPQSVGHRCLARGLSDLAAMGATPQAAFLSLALPQELAGAWADGFFAGLLDLARQHTTPLAGGDLARSPSPSGSGLVSADIVLAGSVPAGNALLRTAARAGDILYVTGTLGGAAAELAALSSLRRKPSASDRSGGHPHLFPQPRVAAGIALRNRKLRIACLDISDGLAIDLSRLCEASGVRAELHSAAIPIAQGATLQQAMTGGEDYELLFTAPASARIPRRLGAVRVAKIGRILPARRGATQMEIVCADGKRSALAAEGWEYFS